MGDSTMAPHAPSDVETKAVERAGEPPESRLSGVLDLPRSIGRYLVLGPLGSGGMGTVYDAFDPTLDRRIAVKVLRSDVGSSEAERLVREARALARLSHPNVVQVYEVEQHDDQTFVAMEQLSGQTLERWQSKRPRPDWRACVEVYRQAGAGLAAAHEQGLVHRDFKPGNAMIDERGRVRVLDFGIARVLGDGATTTPTTGASPSDHATNAPLTEAGSVVGTLPYMPLEQLENEGASPQSDQFSFCVALYEALAGERPFPGRSIAVLREELARGPNQDPPEGWLAPASLYAILARGLLPAPQQRWPSMDALLKQLERLVRPPARRLSIAAVSALGVGLLVGGASLAAYAPDTSARCTGATAALEGAWDDERREDLRRVWGGAPGAIGTRLESRLERYAEAWAQAHRATCEATRVTGEQSEEAMDLRMACLSERRRHLAAAVRALTRQSPEPEQKQQARALAVVEALPPLARCDAVERLRAQRQRVPPPDDPAVAAEVEALRERLAELESEQRIGRLAFALEQFEPVFERVQTVAYLPLVAEARLLHGWLLSSNGRYEDALEDLARAYRMAVEYGDFEVASEAAERQADTLGIHLQRPAEGVVWARAAVSMATWTGKTRTRMASMASLGTLQARRGHFEDAESWLRRAIELGEASLEPDNPTMARTRQRMGALFFEQGKYADAEREHRRALEGWISRYGEEHPRVATGLTNVGAAVASQYRNEEAEAMFRRALALRAAWLGPDHPDQAALLANLGSILLRQEGKIDEAVELYRRAVEIQERALGPDHPTVARYLYLVATAALQQGEPEAARRDLERALAQWERAQEPNEVARARGLDLLGSILVAQGQCTKARDPMARAMEIRRRLYGDAHPDLAFGLNNLARSFECEGAHEQAEQRFREALEIWGTTMGAQHPFAGATWLGLARVELSRGEAEAAREDAEQAIAILEDAQGMSDELAEARSVLDRARTLDPKARDRADRSPAAPPRRARTPP